MNRHANATEDISFVRSLEILGEAATHLPDAFRAANPTPTRLRIQIFVTG